MLYKKVKCYYQNGLPIWCGNWPQDRPILENVTETTCDAIVGPDGRLHHWANYADFRRIQFWEAGQRTPSHSALRLLEIIDKGIYPPKTHRKSA